MERLLTAVTDDNLRTIIRKSMHAKPSQRYQSARLLEQDLRAFLNDHLILNCGIKYSWWDREILLIRRCRNHNDIEDHSRFIAHASVVTATVLLAGVILNLLAFLLRIDSEQANNSIGAIVNGSLMVFFGWCYWTIGLRRSPARQMAFSAIGLLVVISTYVWLFAPSKIGQPTLVEFNTAVMYCIPLVGVFNIIQAGATPRWQFMQYTGWPIILFSPLLAFFPNSFRETNFPVIILLMCEIMCCLNSMMFGWSMASRNDARSVVHAK